MAERSGKRREGQMFFIAVFYTIFKRGLYYANKLEALNET